MLSARNQIKGKVVEVKKGAVNGLVKIDANGDMITANISINSIEQLGLAEGKEACAIVKATEVMVASEHLKLSARNQIDGVVKEVKKGAVNGIVKIDSKAGNKFTSTISIDSINELNLSEGANVVVIIKATSVMVQV